MKDREALEFQATRILLPTDYSPGSDAAVVWAKGLSRLLNAEVLIVHVIEPLWKPESREESQARLDRLAEEFPRARTLIIDSAPGQIGEHIAKIAERDADLVVMGTHGRSGVKRMLIGSVAEHVVRNCRKPVLTVRMEQEAAAAPPD
jgi:nucleotide-binding universal stress UspA family protein